ncbi:putative pectinesterase/pectinesterase inhibitor 45 [Silene latifolia]|uniref:putative pectinesterase/pectinesterase inhibitor 45 n=1 Tax=Silene latifolia TaxID=37657 RepID=UPI003D771B98
MAFEEFGQLSKRRREERAQKFKKKIFLFILLSVILIGGIVGGVFAYLHFSKNKDNDSSKSDESVSSTSSTSTEGGGKTKTSSKVIQTLCHPTDYKKRCEDALNKYLQSNSSTPTIIPKMIIKAAVSAASDQVNKTISAVEKFKFDKPDEKAAYDVCKKLFQDSVDELAEVIKFTGPEFKGLRPKIPDMRTWLSAVYSYQETCIDNFPDGDTKNKIKTALNATKEHVGNSLALISQIEEFLIKTFATPGGSKKPAARRLLEHKTAHRIDQDGFPGWVGHEERKLAVKSTVNLVPNITIAKDGSGNFTTFSDCLKSLPENNNERIFIYVKEGVYEEYVTVSKKLVNITMYGDGSQKTIVTGNKNFVDGVRTFETATFAVLGEGFVGIAMGFRNTAGPEKHQAVALRVQADRSIFLNCRMEAYQDTLYVQTHRQFYRSCYITGTIDFIFGDAAAIFQNCIIVPRKPLDNQQNIITAQGRADNHENTGIVLQNCKIQPDKDLEPVKSKIKTYLGRPWKLYSRTIVMESTIEDFVDPAGWMPWEGDFALKTLYYAEFNNNGPGSNVGKRVNWAGYKKSITKKEAESFTVIPFLQGSSWIEENPNVQVRLRLSN